MSRERPPRRYFNFSTTNIFTMPVSLMFALKPKFSTQPLPREIRQDYTCWFHKHWELVKFPKINSFLSIHLLARYFFSISHTTYIFIKELFERFLACFLIELWNFSLIFLLFHLQQCIFWSFACRAYAWCKMFKTNATTLMH